MTLKNHDFAAPDQRNMIEFGKMDRLEKLRARRLELQKELEKLTEDFADGYTEAIFNYITEKSAGEFLNRWIARVRKETTFFENSDDLGLEIFGENLAQQNGIPFQRYSQDAVVYFDPTLTHQDNPKCLGLAEPGGKIKIKGVQPTQREQLKYFISHGRLHPVVANLTHELVHAYQFDENPQLDRALAESQAYANGIVEALPFDSVEITTEHILRDYDIPKDETTSIITSILFLYARGETTRTVAEKLRAIKPVFNGAWAVEKFYLGPIKKSEGISDEEIDEMVQIYILQNQVERTKAQNIFLEVFAEWMKK